MIALRKSLDIMSWTFVNFVPRFFWTKWSRNDHDQTVCRNNWIVRFWSSDNHFLRMCVSSVCVRFQSPVNHQRTSSESPTNFRWLNSRMAKVCGEASYSKEKNETQFLINYYFHFSHLFLFLNLGMFFLEIIFFFALNFILPKISIK